MLFVDKSYLRLGELFILLRDIFPHTCVIISLHLIPFSPCISSICILGVLELPYSSLYLFTQIIKLLALCLEKGFFYLVLQIIH